jgi:hypothetical protein
LVAAIRRYNIRGSSGKVNLALDAAPQAGLHARGRPHLAGAISIGPSIDYIERL